MKLRLGGMRGFITGGSRGIGLAIARGLAVEGVDVAMCARGGTELAASVRGLGSQVRAIGYVVDVAQPGQLEDAIDKAAATMGGIDLLVANAGGTVGDGGIDSSASEWEATYRLNVLHAAHAVRCARPHMRRSVSPAVLLTSSVSARRPAAPSAYSSAKAAVRQLGKVLARELAEDGIRVNVLSPGSTMLPDGHWERIRGQQPAQFAQFERDEFPRHRLVTAAEVADVACFLLSPRAAGVNGADVAVDGGQMRANMSRFWPSKIAEQPPRGPRAVRAE